MSPISVTDIKKKHIYIQQCIVILLFLSNHNITTHYAHDLYNNNSYDGRGCLFGESILTCGNLISEDRLLLLRRDSMPMAKGWGRVRGWRGTYDVKGCLRGGLRRINCDAKRF